MNRTFRAILLWLIIAVVALPFAAMAGDRVEPSSRVDGAEAALVEETLTTEFESPFARTAVLVLPDIEGADGNDGRARVRSILARFDTLPFIVAITSPASSVDTLLTGTGGTGAIAIVGIDPDTDAADAVDALRAATAGAGTEALWTGLIALETDLRRAGAAETRQSELRAIPVSLLLAVWAFGGIAGAVAGVAAGVLSVLIALALTMLATIVQPVTAIAPGIASLLGLAVGIDYTLLVLLAGRQSARDEGSRGLVRHDAMDPLATIRLAAIAAAAGFAPLLLVPVSELRSAGVAGIAAVAAALMVATGWAHRARAAFGMQPAAVEAQRGRRSLAVPVRPDRDPTPEHEPSSWQPFVRLVVRRPGTALLLSLPPLLLLGAASTRLETGLHDVRTLPPGIESATALERLGDMGRAEVALGLRAVARLPSATTVFDEDGWDALGRIESGMLRDPRIAAVRSIRTVSGGIPPSDVRAVFPETGLRAFTSRDESSALIEIVPSRGMGALAAASLVRDLRSLDMGADLLIGGVPAWSIDYADAIASNAVRAVTLAGLVAFVVLLVAFRSILVAVKAVVLNLLSAAAAVGATVLVFQEGFGGSLLGAPPLDGLFPTVPLLAFCAVFAIGMDYEVFLLARIFAARRSGATDADSIVHGVASSAPVITRAAAIMVAVFVAFAMGDFMAVRMIGFALAVAVTIDATLIRLIVAPALMRIAGRWNWWPGERTHVSKDLQTGQHAIQPAS